MNIEDYINIEFGKTFGGEMDEASVKVVRVINSFIKAGMTPEEARDFVASMIIKLAK